MKKNFSLFKLAEEQELDSDYISGASDAVDLGVKIFKNWASNSKLLQFLKAIKNPLTAASVTSSAVDFAEDPSRNVSSLVDAAATVGSLVNPLAKGFNFGWSAARALDLDKAVADLLQIVTDDKEAVRIEAIGELLLAATKATDKKKALYLINSALSNLSALKDEVDAKKTGSKFNSLIAIKNFENALLELYERVSKSTSST